MDFFDTIRARRSVRRFSDQDVPREDVLTMIEAARLAPSATNEQPWRFIIVRDRELKNAMRDTVNAIIKGGMESTDDRARKQRLAKMKIYSTHFANAPVAIAVLARPWEGTRYSSEPPEQGHRDLGIESASMAAAHILLAAAALGYGSCFSSAPAEFARTELEAMLGVEPPWFLMGIISLGVPSKEPQERTPRKSLEDICTFIG
jgi:nitroreductase